MKVYPLHPNYSNQNPAFKSKTIYQDNKIIEQDILSLEGEKDLFSNPVLPSQNIYGIKLTKPDEKTIQLTSRYGHKTGEIKYNPLIQQPEINVQAGSFQPIVEIEDKELGIKLLLNRGSKLEGKNLDIDYKALNQQNVSFGHSLVITQGYKPQKTSEITKNYFSTNKQLNVEKSQYASKLKQDYTIVGLGGGYGSRLKPISDLNDDNKLSTKYPGTQKSLFELSVLDTAARVGIKSNNIKAIADSPNQLSGTAGIIIKGIKNGSIPTDKPLVVLTGDTFNNIDLPRALYDYENSSNSGIAMVVKKQSDKNIKGYAPISFNENEINSGEIQNLHPIVTEENEGSIPKNSDGNYYIGTNITIINPKILKTLSKFSDNQGKAELVEFLGLMLNTLNKTDENLYSKYPDGLKSEELKLNDLAFSDGTPKPIENTEGKPLKLNAIVAKDINGEDPLWQDVGTIEDFIGTVREISKKDSISGIDKNFISSIKKNVDSSGIIYMNPQAKAKLEAFKKKYAINNISGNVVVQSYEKPAKILNILTAKHINKDIFALTNNEQDAQLFIEDLTKDPAKTKEKTQELVNKYGLNNFMKWYLSPNGYYGAYEKFLDNYYKNASSIEQLLAFQPNWAPWKLEEKAWLLNNPQYNNCSKEERRDLFNSYCNNMREVPFNIGQLPKSIQSKENYQELINRLKREDVKEGTLNIGGKDYQAKRLKGGELNNKFVYLVKSQGDKFILKFDRMNVEDCNDVDYRGLSLLEKKAMRKDKYLAADSIYTNACVSKYLELNGCDSAPKLLYYDHQTNSSAYEFVEDVNEDEFQNGLIDEEYIGLDEMNDEYKKMNSIGIYLNDTAIKNILKNKNGENKIIDLGHCNFIDPTKPGVKHYNVEFANSNGPDIRAMYAGLMFSSLN